MSLDIYPELEQGSTEWHDMRRGMLTASVIDRLISVGSPDASAVSCSECNAEAESPCLARGRKVPTPIKTFHPARAQAAALRPPTYTVADNDTARGLIDTLAGERIAGWTDDTPMSSDMWRGVLHEPLARDAYAKLYGTVTECGLMIRSEDGWRLGYSPDGLVGDDGLIEIKAPRTKNHVRAVVDGQAPDYNMAQLQTGLFVSGRKWIDYIPFVGGLPLYTKRVYPDPAWFEVIRAAAAACEERVAEVVARYEEATQGLAPTERVMELEEVY